jgi:hypothetical protein
VGISSGTSSPCDGKQVDIFPHGLDISETQITENSRPRRRDARRPCGKAEKARRHRPGSDGRHVVGVRKILVL